MASVRLIRNCLVEMINLYHPAQMITAAMDSIPALTGISADGKWWKSIRNRDQPVGNRSEELQYITGDLETGVHNLLIGVTCQFAVELLISLPLLKSHFCLPAWQTEKHSLKWKGQNQFSYKDLHYTLEVTLKNNPSVARMKLVTPHNKCTHMSTTWEKSTKIGSIHYLSPVLQKDR